MFRVNQSSSSLHSWNFDNFVIQTWQNGQKLLQWFWDKNLDQVCSELNASDNLCIRKRNGGAIFRSAVKLQKRTSFNFWWNQVPLLSKFFIFVQLKQLSRAQERFEKECNWCIASKLPELMHFSLSPTPSLSASLMCVCPSLSFSDYLIPSVCLCMYMWVCLALLLLFSLCLCMYGCVGAWMCHSLKVNLSFSLSLSLSLSISPPLSPSIILSIKRHSFCHNNITIISNCKKRLWRRSVSPCSFKAFVLARTMHWVVDWSLRDPSSNPCAENYNNKALESRV